MHRRDFLQLGAMAAASQFFPERAAASSGLGGKRLRGLMIDAARLPSKPEHYRRVIDFAREWSMNAVLFRVTDDQGCAMRFERHPELVTHEHAITAAEAKELSSYASHRGVTLIPEIEPFGHTSYVTSVKQYEHLADTPPGGSTGFVGICPVHPDTRTLVRDLLEEVAAAFDSRYLHAGCDEVNWGGSELSRQALARQSRAEIWTDYLNWLDDECKRLGKEMIVWGDFVAHKEPAILEKLSKRVIVMDWQYYVTDPQALADTRKKITSHGLRAIGAPALITCEWGPRPSDQSLANIDAYVTAYANTDPLSLGVMVTNWVPGRFLANSLWDCFAYAGVSMSDGPDTARRSALRRFVERFYGAKWNGEWDHMFADAYRMTPGRTCTRAWTPPRLPLPAVSDDDVKRSLAGTPLSPTPYETLAENVRALGRKVQRNKTDFAIFSLAFDYLADIVWREAQWKRLQKASAEEVKSTVEQIAHRDDEILDRVDAEWNMVRFEDDRWKRDRLPHLTPYDQLLMRMREAAAYSAELAKDPQRLSRLLGAASG